VLPAASQPPRTTARTRLVALLGHPVSHSLSPQIHSAAFAATGTDAVYVALDVAPADLPDAVRGLRAVGFLGANVTVPHKVAVLDLVDERTEEVEAVGAANTLCWRGEALVADNTDARGLEASVRADIDPAPGAVVLVFGAGGAARAAAVAFGRLGCAVSVRARRTEAAAQVAALALAHGGAEPDPDARPAIVVNATPLGLAGEPLPPDLMALGPGQVALDLIYRSTPFLDAARRGGARAVDGLGMLVGQAAASFERWTGVSAPLEAMRAAVRIAG
jgi:shikimate dehydrogenase